MVHDVLEALNKSGFTEYNKDIEEFVEQIIKSNSEKKVEKKKNSKRMEIENNAVILKMKMVLNEKNEHLKMMNEELEHYIREYTKEKYNYQNSLNSSRALENRIYNQVKQEEREKKWPNYRML